MYICSRLSLNSGDATISIKAPIDFWDFLEGCESEILPNLFFRHITLSDDAGYKIMSTQRDDSDLDALRELVEAHQRGIASERFDSNKKACGSCQYNVLGINGSPVCRDRSKKVAPSVPMHYFNKKNFNAGI